MNDLTSQAVVRWFTNKGYFFGAIFCKLQSYIKGKLGTLDWDYVPEKSEAKLPF